MNISGRAALVSKDRPFERGHHVTTNRQSVLGLFDVPTNWEVRRLKFTSRLRYGLGQPPEEMIGGIPFIRATNIDEGKISDVGMAYVDPSKVPMTRNAFLSAGEILIVRSGALTGDSAIVPAEFDGAVAGFDVVITARTILPKFLAWTLLTPFVRAAQIDLLKTRAAQPHLNVDDVGSIVVCVPPPPEQLRIIEFLDVETGETDALVAKYQQLIEILEEKRSAFLIGMVTKGLHRREMRNSGIEWIGEVPKTWISRKVAQSFALIGSGTTPSAGDSEWYGGETPFVTTSDLRESLIRSSSKCVTKAALSKYSSLRVYPPGTLLIAMYGATIGRVGILDISAATNQACCALSDSRTLINKFAFYWFMAFRKEIVSLGYGGGQPNISQEILRSVVIPSPPIEEQIEIVDHIEKRFAEMDRLVAAAGEAIRLARERRLSLISAAVTGQLDVKRYRSGTNSAQVAV